MQQTPIRLPENQEQRRKFRHGYLYHQSDVPYKGRYKVGRYSFRPAKGQPFFLVACRSGKPLPAWT